MAEVGDTVMVVLDHPDRYVIGWDGKEWTLESGQDKAKFIPFEVAANWFGDPRAVDNMKSTVDHKRRYGWIPDRPTEVRRLRVLYGVQHGDESKVYLPDGIMDTIPDVGDWPDRKRHWLRIDSQIPRVQVFDLETKEKLWTVLEDPAGDHVTPALVTVTREQAQEKRIQHLEELVESLTRDRFPHQGLVTPEGIIPGDPNAKAPEKSAVQRAMEGSGSGGDEEDDSIFQNVDENLITSERSGAAGLPADRS